MNGLKLAQRTDELKKLILEHPNLPIVILANEDSVMCDGSWTYCSDIRFEVGELLDYEYFDYDDVIFTDRDRLEEKIEDDLYEDYHEKSEDEYEQAIKAKIAELEPYWIKVIAIYATN